MEYEIYRSDELYHHGIRGMKWGIRRYQNKDGSLTPRGKKRYAKMEADLKSREQVIRNKERVKAKIEKLSSKRKELAEREEALGEKKKNVFFKSKQKTKNNTTQHKSIKDMTDDELREHTNRMQLESNYYNAQRNLSTAIPVNTSPVKKFTDSLIKDVITPAATNAGRAWFEKKLKDKLGVTDVDPIKNLENKYKKLDLEKKIKDLKKGEPSVSEIVEQLNNLSPEAYDKLVRASNVRYYQEAVKGKGVKPDKGGKQKRDEDDD